jgi:hypothetical protein
MRNKVSFNLILLRVSLVVTLISAHAAAHAAFLDLA